MGWKNDNFHPRNSFIDDNLRIKGGVTLGVGGGDGDGVVTGEDCICNGGNFIVTGSRIALNESPCARRSDSVYPITYFLNAIS